MQVQRQIDRLLAQRAAEWIETLKTGGERERADFVRWLCQSKLHVEHYLEMIAMDRELQALDPMQCPDVDALLAKAVPNVVPLKVAASSRPQQEPAGPQQRPFAGHQRWDHTRRLKVGAALAAGVAALGFAFFLKGPGFLWPAQEINTASGEQRTLSLEDGSVVTLNTHTALRIDYSTRERNLTLESGEAVFKVAHDASRPFIVHTPTASVRALGTQFNVYQRATDTLVSVIEGRVQVITHPSGPGSAASLSPLSQNLVAGEEVRVQHDGEIEKRAHPDIERALAWRQRRLNFDEAPLEEIVEEFNRYSSATRLRLVDIAPGSRRYGGVFDADDPEALAALLERESDLRVERRDGEIVILRR